MSIIASVFSFILILFGGFRIIQIIIALVEAGNAIATAVLSCRVICCGRQEYPGTVQYVGNPPQQFMTIPQNQFVQPHQVFPVA